MSDVSVIDTYELSPHDVVALLETVAEHRESFVVVTTNNTVTTFIPVPLDN